MNYEEMTDFDVNKLVASYCIEYGEHADIFKNVPSKEECVCYLSTPIGESVCVGIFDYCNDPSDSWPIILEHGISIYKYKNGRNWDAHFNARSGVNNCHTDKNPLRAAMIVFLKKQEYDL